MIGGVVILLLVVGALALMGGAPTVAGKLLVFALALGVLGPFAWALGRSLLHELPAPDLGLGFVVGTLVVLGALYVPRRERRSTERTAALKRRVERD